MQRFSRVALVAASSVVLAASGIAASVASAGAGIPLPVTNSLTILKTVSGEVPEGTTFTVEINCNLPIIDSGEGAVDGTTVEFNASGQPTTPDTIDFLSNQGWCEVIESVNGGATSVTYECEGVVTSAPVGGAVAPVCSDAGPTTDPIRVTKAFPTIDATVTVNNTFPEPTPTTTTAPAAKPAAAPAVVARPIFTG